MSDIYDKNAPKKVFEFLLNEDLVGRMERGISMPLPEFIEMLLHRELLKTGGLTKEEYLERAERASLAWNKFVEKHGSLSDEFSPL